MRRCSRCGEMREVGEFARDRSKRRRRKSWCKRCDAARSRAYYERNRERKLAAVKVHQAKLREERGPRLCACGAPTVSRRSRYCEACRLEAELRRHPGWAKLGEDEREQARARQCEEWTVRNRRRSRPA
jgi:hypothetical protein